jgi:glycosyltransferase involved in cell wall biosynthesis
MTIEIVTFTTLYPNEVQPNHGVFVENRLSQIVATGDVASRVVAPVPWFPSSSAKFGHYAAYASVPPQEVRLGLAVVHPRFAALPKIGMSIAPILLFLASIASVRQLQRERDFDLIDAHYFYPDGVAAILLGAIFRKPVIITARGTDINLIPQFRLPRALIKMAARRAGGIVAVSRAIKDAIVKLGLPPELVTVLRNGVDLKKFHPGGRELARAELGLNGRTLLSVGQLIERKGHEFVIGAMPGLPHDTLLIAGEGPDRVILEDLAKRLGVAKRVRFLGSVPHRDLQKIYAASDALILASSREGWPNVLLEAMACGTPAVATPIWGNPEVVSCRDAGVLMQSRSALGVIAGVEELFRTAPDRTATRAYAEGFSWEATTTGQIDLFKAVLKKSKERDAT